MMCCILNWITAIATAVSASAAVIAVFITLWSLHINRKVEKARMRPVVMAEITCRDNTYSFVIRNIGLTTAREIKTQVSPHIAIGLSEKVKGEIPFLKHIVPQLFPTTSLESAFVIGYDALNTLSNEMRFSIELEYSDDSGVKYCEEQKLDVRLIADAAIVHQRTGSQEIGAAIKTAGKEVTDAIGKVLKAN